MRKALKQAAETLTRARKVALASHVNPDGDALGSMLALTHALRGLGITCVPLSADGVPDIYRWMPGQEWIRTSTPDRDFDVAVVCDTGIMARVGSARETVESAPCIINIDHHASEGAVGHIRFTDARAAATGELVYDLLPAMGTPLSREIADCLLCAIITDTGSFRFLNVTPRTFTIAARLMECGARPAEVSERVFECHSMASTKLLGRALGSLRLTADGLIAWARVRASDFEELGATDEDTEGIVNHVRSIKGVRIGILFREIPGRKVRISIRAREGADANALAEAFGGGGHRLAAGCSLDPPLEEAERRVLEEAARWV